MAKRKSIHIEGMEHGAPIPNGTVIGSMVFSSAISGKDAKTGVLSSDPDEQAEAMFRNLRLFMKQEPRIDSIRKFLYQDQKSYAHIDMDIVPRIEPDGRNSYIISMFAWTD